MDDTKPFSINYQVTWGDLDANMHMANRAYLDYASQTRFLFINEQGFTPADFQHAQMGPVIFSDNIQYLKELRFLEKFYVEYWLGGNSRDYSKFLLINKFYREDGKLAALLETSGAWFNLSTRKVMAPPEKLISAIDALLKTEGYKEL